MKSLIFVWFISEKCLKLNDKQDNYLKICFLRIQEYPNKQGLMGRYLFMKAIFMF